MSLDLNVTTTAGEVFSHADSARMAALVYRRFGRDMLSARDAWQRLLENNADLSHFKKLVVYGLALERFEELSANNEAYANPDAKIDNLIVEFTKEILS